MRLLNKFILGLVLILYLLFGLSYSSKQGFWHDEIYTLTFLKGISVYEFDGSVWSAQLSTYDVNYFKHLLAEDNFYSNFSTQILHEGHPPLYFLLLKLWSFGFGTSETALRSFSLCCGIITFLVLFNLFKQNSERVYTSWIVLGLLLLNPFLFYFFTEARMYAFALLLATLSFRYWLDYQEYRRLKSKTFLIFCLSSISLLYTHYYGLFFLSSLAFIEILRVGFKKSIFNHGLSLLFFLPWFFVIRKQLNFHNVHWTDGIISFGESITGFFHGILHLMISPMSDASFYEKGIVIGILLITTAFLFAKEWKFTLILLSTILIYGIQIYVFDQIVGHHSILVPRYYIFVLIFVYWGIYKLIDSSYRLPSLFVTVTYCSICSIVIFQLYNLGRAPKQMFREVAAFVDSHLDPKSRVLVFEPKGPLILGIAYYLQNNFELVPADKASNNLESSAVYIDEMLGVAYRENKYHREQQGKLELIPFVGIFLYK